MAASPVTKGTQHQVALSLRRKAARSASRWSSIWAGHLSRALAPGERRQPLLLDRFLLRHGQSHRRRWCSCRRRGQRQPGQRRLAGAAAEDSPSFPPCIDIDVGAEVAPHSRAATALADVLRLLRLLARLLGHLAAATLERLEPRQVGGRAGLGQLASLDHVRCGTPQPPRSEANPEFASRRTCSRFEANP